MKTNSATPFPTKTSVLLNYRSRLALVFFALFLPLAACSLQTGENKDVLLTILKNDGGVIKLDRAKLESFDVHTLITATSWADGPVKFEGVLVKEILDLADASGDELVAKASDDYEAYIPLAHFEKYPILLAYKANGKILTSETKGPLRIVYPRDDFEEINEDFDAYWAWSVVEFRFE